MPPKKRVKKSRARKPVKKGLKQKQKQKQQQRVNVSVSAGGAGGGGTQFIPMPQAPAFDYMQLANLIRPANTVDIPIRAQANPEPLPMRDAEAQTLAEELPKVGGGRPSIFGEPRNPFESGGEFERPVAIPKARKVRSDAGIPRGGRSGSPTPMSGGEYERMREAQKSGTFM